MNYSDFVDGHCYDLAYFLILDVILPLFIIVLFNDSRLGQVRP